MSPLAANTRGEIGVIELTEESVGHGSRNASGPAIEQALQDLGDLDMVMDCGQVQTLTSAAMGYVVAVHRRQESKGKRLALARVSQRVALLLDTAKLLQVLRVAPTFDEAIAMLEPHPRHRA